jgi:hypothetical protein
MRMGASAFIGEPLRVLTFGDTAGWAALEAEAKRCREEAHRQYQELHPQQSDTFSAREIKRASVVFWKNQRKLARIVPGWRPVRVRARRAARCSRLVRGAVQAATTEAQAVAIQNHPGPGRGRIISIL